MLLEGPHAVRVLVVEPEHGRLDVVAVEVVDEQGHRVDVVVGVVGDVLEHVLRREAHLLGAVVVEVRGQELVDLASVADGHAHEGLDDADVLGVSHVRSLASVPAPARPADRTRPGVPPDAVMPAPGGGAGIAMRSWRGTTARTGRWGDLTGGGQWAAGTSSAGVPACTSWIQASISSSLARRR